MTGTESEGKRNPAIFCPGRRRNRFYTKNMRQG